MTKHTMPDALRNYIGWLIETHHAREVERHSLRPGTRYAEEAERLIRAVQTVLGRLDSVDLRMIRLVYFTRTKSVMGAGLEVGLSRAAAYQHMDKILTQIAGELGLFDIE